MTAETPAGARLRDWFGLTTPYPTNGVDFDEMARVALNLSDSQHKGLDEGIMDALKAVFPVMQAPDAAWQREARAFRSRLEQRGIILIDSVQKPNFPTQSPTQEEN